MRLMKDLLARIKRSLKVTFSEPGIRLNQNLGSHQIDLSSGYWADVNHSANKPPRWLLHLDVSSTPPAVSMPGGVSSMRIGAANFTQDQPVQGVIFRVLPLAKLASGHFARNDQLECRALFLYASREQGGSSSDSFRFDVNTGKLYRMKSGNEVELDYVYAAIIGLIDPATQISFGPASSAITLSYGQVVSEVAAFLGSIDRIKNSGTAPTYYISHLTDREDLLSAIGEALGQTESFDDECRPADLSTFELSPHPDLRGIAGSVYEQISAALRAGKRHIMLYGPPGTGKTTLATYLASQLSSGEWTLVTGSADWSSQDLIGGYQPLGDGAIGFVPGILLRNFNQPIVIDELNRCDIDKVIGPLFTVLSGQATTLPHRTDVSDPTSQHYVILPECKHELADHEFAPGPKWRIIATINTLDKSSLYQMSFALSRRFGWVYIDIPSDPREFIEETLRSIDPSFASVPGSECPLAAAWAAISEVRRLGPAPVLDAIKLLEELAPSEDLFRAPSPLMQGALVDVLEMAFLPLLDGIGFAEAESIGDALVRVWHLSPELENRVRVQLRSIAV